MSTTRDPDRMLRAWLDLMPDEAPDRAIAAVLHATAAAPQARDLPRIGRWRSPMNRLFLSIAAALAVVLVGGAIFLMGTRPPSVGSTPIPSSSPSPSPSPAPSPTPAQAPESLRSSWVAYAGAAASPGSQGALLRLVISPDGARVSVFDAGVESFTSTPVGTQTTEFDLISTGTAGGCQIGDLGRYGFAFGTDGTLPGSDGTLLAFTIVSDACPARAAALDRTWVHAIDADSNGGRGVTTAFAPMFLITLPPAGYVAAGDSDSLTLTSTTPDRTLLAVRNPVGRTTPCSPTGGAKLPVAPTIKGFTAYMRTLPGFTVQSSALLIDGHPAVLLTIPSIVTADCPSHRVNEYTTGAGDGSGGWALTQGDTDVVYLVEVDGNLVLLQWLGAGVTRTEEQALLATIRFTVALPQ